MGRTNPTYRDWLDRTEQRWQPFRRALRTRDQEDFDRLFERAARHADAAGYLNAAEPEHAMLLSMLLAQERDIRQLSARVSDLESSVASGPVQEPVEYGTSVEDSVEFGTSECTPDTPDTSERTPNTSERTCDGI